MLTATHCIPPPSVCSSNQPQGMDETPMRKSASGTPCLETSVLLLAHEVFSAQLYLALRVSLTGAAVSAEDVDVSVSISDLGEEFSETLTGTRSCRVAFHSRNHVVCVHGDQRRGTSPLDVLLSSFCLQETRLQSTSRDRSS